MSNQTSNSLAEQWKICLIDDEKDLREIYTVALMADDFNVVSAPDGKLGLDLIYAEHPDAIILDLQMPVMDGFEVLQKIADDPNISKIPVIVLSNTDDESTFRKVGKFNTKFFLIKALTTPRKVSGILRETFRG